MILQPMGVYRIFEMGDLKFYVGKFMGDSLSLRGVLPQENLEIWNTLGPILSLLDPYFNHCLG